MKMCLFRLLLQEIAITRLNAGMHSQTTQLKSNNHRPKNITGPVKYVIRKILK